MLASRRRFTPISETEWSRVLLQVRKQDQRRVRRVIFYIAFILLLCAFLAWAIGSKPEKMPNIYEIPEG
jgi:hypothetical protein